jgi:hypothetical protein
MKRIVLTEQQAKLLSAFEAVDICDPAGHVIVSIPPELTPEEFAKIRRAKDSAGPWVPAAQVENTLLALEEAWQREGPFDLARARAIVKEVRAARES